MKTAVVYYSLDGNCAFVAEQLKVLLNADLTALETKARKRRTFIGKLFWGLGMVMSKKKPPLKPWSFEANNYDLVIVGAPVWASSPAPPVFTFLSEAGIKGKKIALYLCHAGNFENAFDKFTAYLDGSEVILKGDFKSPLKNTETAKQQITDWVKLLSANNN